MTKKNFMRRSKKSIMLAALLSLGACTAKSRDIETANPKVELPKAFYLCDDNQKPEGCLEFEIVDFTAFDESHVPQLQAIIRNQAKCNQALESIQKYFK